MEEALASGKVSLLDQKLAGFQKLAGVGSQLLRIGPAIVVVATGKWKGKTAVVGMGITARHDRLMRMKTHEFYAFDGFKPYNLKPAEPIGRGVKTGLVQSRFQEG